MNPKKIFLFITIILYSIFFNINNVSAATKSKCDLGDKGGTCTFYKSDKWTFDAITKYKDLCMSTINSYTGSGKCVFYYKESLVSDQVKCNKDYTKCEVVNATKDKTAIYDPSNKKTIKDGYVVKEKDISSNNNTDKKEWSKMVITFSDKGQIGLAYDILGKKCKNSPKTPIDQLCKFGATVTSEEKDAHVKDAITDDDKSVEWPSLDEIKDLNDIISPNVKNIKSCEELLEDADDLKDIIQTIVNITKIMVPIGLIIFGVLDFGKAIFSADENKMKEAQAKFTKRLIIALAFFLIPVVLKILLTIANQIWGGIDTSLCGIEL